MRTNLSASVKPDMVKTGARARIVARNTFQFESPEGDRVTRLHHTDVVRITPRGKIILNSGGWKTPTTKDRMNRYVPGGYRVESGRGQWRVTRDGQSIGYYDGMVLPDAFDKPAQRKKADAAGARERKLKTAIRQFVCTAIPNSMPSIPAPSAGDCWLCAVDAAKIREAAERNNGAGGQWVIGSNEPSDGLGSADHIREHVREGYMHGTLIANAVAWRRATYQALRYQANPRACVRLHQGTAGLAALGESPAC